MSVMRVISVISAVQSGEQGQCPEEEEEAVGAGVDGALLGSLEPGTACSRRFVPSPLHGTARRELRALGGVEGMKGGGMEGMRDGGIGMEG